MLGSRNNLLVDRRVYAYKGSWQSPKQDLKTNIFYFINEHTLVESYDGGREQMKPQYTITVFGEHPIIAYDKITLQNGETYTVQNITFNHFENNILVRDLLKQKVQSMTLVLE